MTDREKLLAGWFFITIGAVGLLFSIWSIIHLSPPPPTTSYFRAGFAKLLVAMFGVPGGYVAFEAIFGIASALMLWLGLNVRKP